MMPSKSPQQHRFMEAVAHNPKFAKEAGVPQAVGQEFADADKAKTASEGRKKVTTALMQRSNAGR